MTDDRPAHERMHDPTLTPRERSNAGLEYHHAKIADQELVEVDPKVWFQTSRRYRMVARLPTGTTGIEALAKVWGVRRVEGMPEWSAGDYYLRVLAPERDRLVLNERSFAHFLKNGGGTYR